MYAVVDQQISLDLGKRGSQLLYTAARNGAPLTKVAAESLSAAIEPGNPVLLTTGFPVGPTAARETDGPLGTVVLADALATLGANPQIVVDDRTRPIVEALCAELALTANCVAPPGDGGESLLDETPTAVIAVETPGRTADGSYRNMAGEDISAQVTPRDALFEAAAEQGVCTVGIGDGGNEIGMGTITDAVATHVDHGETIGCLTPVETLVVAGVSNWGAYGVVCGLSILTGRQLLHTGVTERELLATAVEAGAVDGTTGGATESVDGIPGEIHAGVVEILQYCANRANAPRKEPSV